jgi:hypothetical protein
VAQKHEGKEMFVGANKKVKRVVFPIFRLAKLPNQMQLQHVGAGFFLDDQGRFATCAHLFDNTPPGATFEYFGHLPEQLQVPPIRVEELAHNDEGDVVIGRLKMPNPTSYLPMARGMPEVGQQVCIFGYPLAVLSTNARGGPDFSQVRRYPQPSFVLDTANIQVGMRIHRGFWIRDSGLCGMSGGPVVDEAGTVVGMQAAIISRKTKIGDHDVVVHNAVAIATEHVRALYKTAVGDDLDDSTFEQPSNELNA